MNRRVTLPLLFLLLTGYFPQGYAQIRLNAGFPYGPIANFDADNYFTLNDSKEAHNNNITTPGGITNPQIDEDIYLSSRASDLYGGGFGYNIPVSCGTYTVVLHFAEIYHGAPGGAPCSPCTGMRVFNIDIEEGMAGVNNFDIVAAAGGPVTATSLTFANLNITDGNLDIDFQGVTDGPIINAIEVLPVSGPTEATFTVNPGCTLGANTFTDGSFQISNTSPGGQNISSVSLHLNSAILPKLVFDPSGTAGDASGKDFTPNSGAANVLPGAHSFSDPLGNGGFQSISIPFSDFNPGESFTFSIDIDPTSIEGLLTAETSLAATLSGSELTGATVSVNFSDGSSVSGKLYPMTACNGAAEVMLSSCNDIATPVIKSTVDQSPTLVYNTSQFYTVYGKPGDQACVWVAESGFYDGTVTPNGFEANDVTAVAQYCGTIAADGKVSVPFSLFGDDGDINRVTAVVKRSGLQSETTPLQVMQSSDIPAQGQSVCINVGAMASLGDTPLLVNGMTFELDDDSYWTNGDLGHASYLTGPDPISNTTADQLYLKDRHGFDMSFAYPGLASGIYTVQLYFAETYHGVAGGNPAGGVGSRIMDIAIEGNTVLSNFDIYDLYGPTTANIQTFSAVSVTDGTLNIDFTKPSGPDVPAVQAICIIPIDNPTVFPVELLGFEAIPHAYSVELKWATASEINNHFFTVEKSADGRIFESVGRVEGAGTSNRRMDYRFTDRNPLQGVSYYRLKQTDFDGSFSYSNVAVVNFGKGLSSLTVFPNPSNGQGITVELVGYAPEKFVNLQLTDMLGRVLLSRVVQTGISGNQSLRLDLAGRLTPGMYQVQVIDGFEHISQRIIIH